MTRKKFPAHVVGPRRRLVGIALLVAALAMTIATALIPVPAQAAEACVPDASTACIQGIIKTSAGEPAAGIGLDLTGAGDPATTQTDAEGRWVFAVTKAGEYTVKLDQATLPEGQFPKNADSRTVNVELYSSASALFPLTDDAAAAGGAGSGSGTDGGDSDSATGSDSGSGSTQGPASTNQQPGGDTATGSGTSVDGGGFSWPRFWQQFASGIRMGLLLSLAALGLSLVFGTTGLSNFAQGEMLSLGGILAWAMMSLTHNIWLAGLAVVVLMAAFGWVQDAGLWKPLRKRRLSLMQMMIVSIGLSIALQNLIQFFVGARVLRIDNSTPKTVTILGVTLTVQSYVAMGIALAAVIAVGLALKYTRFGRATRAVSDNPALAEASGIDVNRVIRLVWTVGTALAGLSGVLLGLVLNGVAWNTGWSFLLLLFAAVVLGGIGTAFGAFIGAMIIGLIVEMANIWLPGDLKHAAALFILIVVLLVRPQGIFGRRERIG